VSGCVKDDMAEGEARMREQLRLLKLRRARRAPGPAAAAAQRARRPLALPSRELARDSAPAGRTSRQDACGNDGAPSPSSDASASSDRIRKGLLLLRRPANPASRRGAAALRQDGSSPQAAAIPPPPQASAAQERTRHEPSHRRACDDDLLKPTRIPSPRSPRGDSNQAGDSEAANNDTSRENTNRANLVPVPETGSEPRFKDVVTWSCNCCEQECIPVREQSRCLCGHRLKDHPKDPHTGKLGCSNPKCRCQSFFYIVAEGAWILRCSCKHKHTDHDSRSHACTKPNCRCSKFFSPWVCNCDHPWQDHTQRLESRRVKTLAEMCMAGENDLCIGGDNIKRTDLLAEPLHLAFR